MNNLTLNLKVFKIDDGEDYFILAHNEEEARNYYENSGEIIDSEIKEELERENGSIRESYDIKEVTEKSNKELKITDDEPLLNMLHQYKPKTQWNNSVRVMDYAKYIVLEAETRKEKLKLPTLIGGSVQ